MNKLNYIQEREPSLIQSISKTNSVRAIIAALLIAACEDTNTGANTLPFSEQSGGASGNINNAGNSGNDQIGSSGNAGNNQGGNNNGGASGSSNNQGGSTNSIGGSAGINNGGNSNGGMAGSNNGGFNQGGSNTTGGNAGINNGGNNLGGSNSAGEGGQNSSGNAGNNGVSGSANGGNNGTSGSTNCVPSFNNICNLPGVCAPLNAKINCEGICEAIPNQQLPSTYTPTESSSNACKDGLDNDCDGATDKNDSSCAAYY